MLLALFLLGCPAAPVPDPREIAIASGDGATAPADAPGGGGGAVVMPKFEVAPGTGAKLSGTFVYEGAAKGTYRVDFFNIGPDGRPRVLHAMTLDKPGPWELEAPKGLGKINVLAFVDAQGNGPQLVEPSALLKDVDVEADAIPALDLTLVDGAADEFATDSPTMLNPEPPLSAPPSDGAPPSGPPPPTDQLPPPDPPPPANLPPSPDQSPPPDPPPPHQSDLGRTPPGDNLPDDPASAPPQAPPAGAAPVRP